MEKENKNCILLKRKEYDELVKDAKLNNININNAYRYSLYNSQTNNIQIDVRLNVDELSSKLQNQIERISSLISKSLLSKFKQSEKELLEKKDSFVKNGYDNACKEIAKMSWLERRKFLKQYK